MSDVPVPANCPTCRATIVRRIGGHWCPKCRRYLVQRLVPVYTKAGEVPLVLAWGVETRL